MRPLGLTGAAHRGGGAARRRATERSVGHAGGVQAKARRRERQAKNAKTKRVRVVQAARQVGEGRVQLSISSVEKTVASGSVAAASVVAPAVSDFWKRVQSGANRMFNF